MTSHRFGGKLGGSQKLILIGLQTVITNLPKNIYNYFAKPLDNVNYKTGTVIVMGSEDEGVSKEIANISDELIRIPMPGKAESLNVAIAHGIIAFEVVRQRIKTTSFHL